jgi:hypothetical protein
LTGKTAIEQGWPAQLVDWYIDCSMYLWLKRKDCEDYF